MIVGAMLVRNEQDRKLRQVLEQMRKLCGKIVILDDNSTDKTPDICREYGAEVHLSKESLWGSNEIVQRKRLWQLATSGAKPGDWILCLDADETLSPKSMAMLPNAIMAAEILNIDGIGIAFRLFDMWSETHYRDDQFWTAHNRPWIMLIKYDPSNNYTWNESALHCGRFPLNACDKAVFTGLKLQHWGWSKPEDRKIKFDRYMKADPEGKHGIMEQYLSILDEKPATKLFTD